MAYPPTFLDQLRQRIRLSELVGKAVKLTPCNGREYRGLCPFHHEKTASFYVVDDKDLFHCFGCGAYGDQISWLRRTEGLEFREAVEQLAELAGLELPKQTPQQRARYEREETLHDVLEGAASWFERRLVPGGPAWGYLRDRGLEEVTIRQFRIGWAPNDRHALHRAFRGDSSGLLVDAGLIRQPEHGEAFDFFRGRVMFPIVNRRGRVIAFSGRTLSADPQIPKYLNSPETDIFRKGSTLYGVHRPCVDGHRLLVVEGTMDVIALAQAGFAAVAPLGTAVTANHLSELWRLADEPIICFDGDAAGVLAAKRLLKTALPLLRPGRSVWFAPLPVGEDPDSLVRTRGRPALDEALDAALPMARFLLEVEAGLRPIDTPERVADLRRRLDADCEAIMDKTVSAEYRVFLARALEGGLPILTLPDGSASAPMSRTRAEAVSRLLAAVPGLALEFASDLAALELAGPECPPTGLELDLDPARARSEARRLLHLSTI